MISRNAMRSLVRVTNTLRRGAGRRTAKTKTVFRRYTAISRNFRRHKAVCAYKHNALKRSALVSPPVASILINPCRRYSATSSPQSRSFDDLPSQTLAPEEMGRFLYDPEGLFNEQFAMIEAAGSQMLRMEAFGQQYAVLFSHDLIKVHMYAQWL